VSNGTRGVLTATATANALIFLDQTSVAVALPAIQTDLGASRAELEWIIGAYLLSLATFMAAAGRLADLYGRRRMFLAGLAVFGAASVACALAPTELVLIVARLVQGVGAALVQPLALANITAALPEERRGWAIGFLASIGTSCLSIGPVVGGALVEIASWRWIFALNMPIVLFSFAAGVRSIQESRDPDAARMDWSGAVLLLAGLGAVVASLLHLHEWPAGRAAAGAALGAALLIVFVLVEHRREHPLIPVALLRRPPVAGPLIALLAIQFVVLASTVYVLLYLQRSLDYGALAAGFLILPAALWSALLSTVTGRMADEHGSRRLVFSGLLLAAGGLAGVALATAADEVWLLLVALLAFGLSRPVVFTPAGSAAIHAIPRAERGLASSLVTEARQLGAVLGVAVAGAVVAAVESEAGGDPAEALSDGVAAAMLVSAGLAAAAAVLSRRLIPDRRSA
jgi:EmrB/QacA subfamily drug resistance transporter